MFGFLQHILKLKFLFVVLAVLVGVYRSEISTLIKDIASQYLETAVQGESVALRFNEEALYQSDESTASAASLFTSAQLATYNGENGAPIYLALLGEVFDVSRGIKHYGPGCSYNYFVGRDASVSFISGEFEKYDPEHADDVLTLKPADLLGLNNWKNFYSKDYVYKGKLIGRFYDERGVPTSYHHMYLALLDQAMTAKSQVDELRTKYPDCNIEWSDSKGTRVWCTPTSGGGNARDWVGYPRKLYSRGNKNFHCACVPDKEIIDVDAGHQAMHGDAMFKPYDDCAPRSHECFYRV